MIHKEPSEFAGKTVRLKDGIKHPQYDMDGQEFQVEDWVDRVTGKYRSTLAALVFAIRREVVDLPVDNEVVYGKFNGMGVMIHVSEIEQ